MKKRITVQLYSKYGKIGRHSTFSDDDLMKLALKIFDKVSNCGKEVEVIRFSIGTYLSNKFWWLGCPSYEDIDAMVGEIWGW